MVNLTGFLNGFDGEEIDENKMPKITRDKSMESKFLDDLKAKMDEEDEERLNEIHVSDLVYCLKKTFYRRKGIEKIETRESLMIKSIGKGLHYLYEVLKDYVKEAEIHRYGVVGHIDMLGEYPVELKTSRKNIKSIEDIPENYLRQIGYYCLLTDKTIGYLIHIYIVKPSIKIFKLDYSQVIEKYKAEFFERLEKLKKALENDDPSILENTNYNWECDNCPFRNICLKKKHVSLEVFSHED